MRIVKDQKIAYWMLRGLGFSDYSYETKDSILDYGNNLTIDLNDKKILSTGFSHDPISLEELYQIAIIKPISVGKYGVYPFKGHIKIGCQIIPNSIVREIYGRLS